MSIFHTFSTEAISSLDPLRMAILFLGLAVLGVIWLAWKVVKLLGRQK